MVSTYAPTLTLTKGARQLLLKLQQEGLRLVVATSAKSQELFALLEVIKIEDLLAQTTTSAADIVRATPAKLQLQPNEAIVLGDTPYEIESANAARVDVIAFHCRGFDDT